MKPYKRLWPMRFPSRHLCVHQAQMGVLCPSKTSPATAGRATLRSQHRHLATASTDCGPAKRQGVNVLPGKKPITDHFWPYTFPGWIDWPASSISYASQQHSRGRNDSYLKHQKSTMAVGMRQAEGQRQFLFSFGRVHLLLGNGTAVGLWGAKHSLGLWSHTRGGGPESSLSMLAVTIGLCHSLDQALLMLIWVLSQQWRRPTTWPNPVGVECRVTLGAGPDTDRRYKPWAFREKANTLSRLHGKIGTFTRLSARNVFANLIRGREGEHIFSDQMAKPTKSLELPHGAGCLSLKTGFLST